MSAKKESLFMHTKAVIGVPGYINLLTEYSSRAQQDSFLCPNTKQDSLTAGCRPLDALSAEATI